MRRMHEIITPENVIIKYELAGLGSRFAAMVLDTLIQGVLVLVVAITISLLGVDAETTDFRSVFIALGIIALFIIVSGYFIFFELIMEGQTPGKKAAGIKVMKYTGEPVTLIDSFLRNILRTADMLPGSYLVGAAFILFSQKYRRIGDFAANTVVVKVKWKGSSIPSDIAVPDCSEPVINRFPVTEPEYQILKEFLQRKEKLGARKEVFIYHLHSYFMKKFELEKPIYADPTAFFKDIVKMNSEV